MNLSEKIRYFLEFLVVKFGIFFFRLFGFKNASNIAGKIAIFIGKKHKVNKLAFKNISKAIPELPNEKKELILTQMWDNLGRIVGEYPYICDYNNEKISKIVSYSDNFKKNIEILKNSKKGGIIISGHIGNWEIGPKSLISQGLKINVVYRPLNNPYVEKLTANMRQKFGVKLIPKSSKGNRQIIEAIKNGEFVIILADQKISEGYPIKFFHDDALTTTSIARIALKYDILAVPARVIRKNNHEFIIDMDKPLPTKSENSKKSLDIIEFCGMINLKLENWIKEYPEQWFWVHNRWKK